MLRIYQGGDVGGRREDGLDVVNLMHGHELPGHEVVRGVRLGGLREALAKVGEGRASPQDFKFFSKYAGWGPGQLEAEVEAKSWYVAACDVGTVLEQHLEEDQPDRLWREILIRMGGPFEDIAQNAAQQRSSQ
jgi:putative transcriptional regulator